MNIAIFTNAYKPIISGVVNCIDLMRENLIKKGHNVFLFAPEFSGYTDKEENVYRYPSVSLTNKVKFPVPITIFPIAEKIMTTKKIDIIHCHHPFVLGAEGARWAERLKVPLFFTFHTQYEQYAHYIPFPEEFVKSVSKSVVSSYAKKCSVIITPGTAIVEQLKGYGITKNVVHMPNSINLSSFSNPDGKMVREKYNIGTNEKLLVYVGRMAQEKNIPMMIDSFSIINDKAPSRLMIIGEGPELEYFKTYAKDKGLDERIIFTGRVEYDRISEYYGSADAFVMTSTTEVKPLALLEAMASGLPIIAVNACGASDTIINGYNGLLTGESKEEFANAVIKVITDKELLKTMKQNSIKVSEDYSVEKITDKLLILYTEAIKNQKTSGHRNLRLMLADRRQRHFLRLIKLVRSVKKFFLTEY